MSTLRQSQFSNTQSTDYPSCKIEPNISQQNQAKKKIPPKGNILHIANIHPKLSYEQIKQGLYNLFSMHGPIYDITIKTKQNGSHFAFIDYPNIYDTEKALIASKKQGKILQNQELIVNYCEDPKKNQARKEQKCFLCLGTGHKAKNCTVKPQLIKPKKNPHQLQKEDKKQLELSSISKDQSYFIRKRRQQSDEIHFSSDQQSNEDQQSDSEQEQPIKQERMSVLYPKRDKDYLRFLKLKKKLLQEKLRKKIKKQKKSKRK